MAGVFAIIAALIIWRFFMVFGTAVFAAAGLPGPAAGFEARSALVGVGYTTSQSELVVRSPPARRVAALLAVFGYFGPAVILALLGVSFVVPTDEGLTARFVWLLALLTGLVVVDRIGLIKLMAGRPAMALARRMTGNVAVEQWIVVGDHVVAAVTIPQDDNSARELAAALTDADLSILAIDSLAAGTVVVSANTTPAPPSAGDRVVVFGPYEAVDAIRDM